MAPKVLALHYLLTLTITLILTFSSAGSHSFATKSSRAALGLKEEKITHLHFYMHDVFGGPKATAIPVTKVLDNNTFYGGLYMADDPLTLGPRRDSKPVGNGGGTYAFPSPKDFVLEMNYNLGFTHGDYNGSSLCLMGRIAPKSIVNEMAIVGGTGVFRFASGYAVTKRVVLDFKAQVVVREFNVYVSHY
ncbi:unnamed protein product [Linum trigynum]|uniref:Dirigent protein n=1 Tax=Linum trigynum TaxID=586398 RepID=A0AAV2DAN9_9ROSI